MAQTAMEEYSSTNSPTRLSMGQSQLNRRHEGSARFDTQIKSRLERQSDSMPRLTRANDDASSRRSMLSTSQKLHQSVEALKPLKAERSLMKMTGSNIIGGAANASNTSLDYGIIKEGK